MFFVRVASATPPPPTISCLGLRVLRSEKLRGPLEFWFIMLCVLRLAPSQATKLCGLRYESRRVLEAPQPMLQLEGLDPKLGAEVPVRDGILQGLAANTEYQPDW